MTMMACYGDSVGYEDMESDFRARYTLVDKTDPAAIAAAQEAGACYSPCLIAGACDTRCLAVTVVVCVRLTSFQKRTRLPSGVHVYNSAY